MYQKEQYFSISSIFKAPIEFVRRQNSIENSFREPEELKLEGPLEVTEMQHPAPSRVSRELSSAAAGSLQLPQ